MAFKLGSESRRVRSSKDTPIFRKKLDKGILGEANMDGSIYIDKSVPKNSALEKRVKNHEGLHAKEMKAGKISYTDEKVTDRIAEVEYKREDGELIVTSSKTKGIKPGDKFKEGDSKLPHETRAEKAEKS